MLYDLIHRLLYVNSYSESNMFKISQNLGLFAAEFIFMFNLAIIQVHSYFVYTATDVKNPDDAWVVLTRPLVSLVIHSSDHEKQS